MAFNSSYMTYPQNQPGKTLPVEDSIFRSILDSKIKLASFFLLKNR